jgi:hypothetical protein
MRQTLVSLVVMLVVCVFPTVSHAQAPAANGTLHITVVDSTGAVLPGALVTIAGIEGPTKAITPEPIRTTNQGVAIIPKLVPGRYSVQAEFQGFETRRLPDVRVRNGESKQVLMLPIEGVKEAVMVGQDKQSAAADPRGSSFGTTLTREQLEALSDDPDVLRQQLQEMAGPGATIKIDSFEGSALPPKAQIRSIRISRDQFAAEHHAAGGTIIEIITQPGMGPIRFHTGFRMRGDRLSGRSPFTPERGPEQFRNAMVGGGGTLVKNKASFNLFFNGTDSFETPNINASRATGGTRSEALTIRSPRDNYSVNGNVDYAVTIDQTLRFGFNVFRNDNRNLGIGLYDYEERAFSNETTFGSFRAQQIGPLGRRAFLRTRFQYGWNDSNQVSALEAPTIRVLDEFTRGGAQVRGGQHSKILTLGGDLDYVRGLHTWRTGVQLDAGRWRSDDTSNYLGTYTFESLEAFNEGRPRSYTRRIGDPNLQYENYQGAVYLQDDMRVRRNLTLSAGLRYEAQSHVGDSNNVMPRFGLTYAPGAAGQTTLRASWGVFYDWFSMNTYEQTLRVDGFRQQEIDIFNPSFPDPVGTIGLAPPVNRYLLNDDFTVPRSTRVSLGIDQRLFRGLQGSATFAYTRGGSLARGLNRNAPVDGIRPSPQFGNVVEVVSDASSRTKQLQVNVTANPGALMPINNSSSARLFNVRRTTLFLNYTLASNRNNTDGAFSIAPLGDQDFEWGPANGDVRHRFNVSVNNQIIKNVMMGININAATAPPYTIRTGRDNNGDLIFNDRPDGVGRNSARGSNFFVVNMMLGYGFSFGRAVGGPPGIGVIMGGGAPVVQSVDQGQRYRMQFMLQAMNITNRANYIGYSGTQTSQFFGRPTSVQQMRRVEAGVNFMF